MKTRQPRVAAPSPVATEFPAAQNGDIMKVTMEQDIVGLIRVLTPIAAMTPTEYARLMKDIDAHDASPEVKSTALMMLASFAPETDFRERIESLLRQGAAPGLLGESIRRWASSDPDAALAFLTRTHPNESVEDVDARMLTLLADADRIPFTDRAEWIVQNADEKVVGEKLHSIITNEIELGETVAKWIGTQAPGTVRDQAQAAYAEITALRSGLLAGLWEAEAIADPDLKFATRRGIAKTWLRLS